MFSLMCFTTVYSHSSFPGGPVVKDPPAGAGDARDADLIPGWGCYMGSYYRLLIYSQFIEQQHTLCANLYQKRRQTKILAL